MTRSFDYRAGLWLPSPQRIIRPERVRPVRRRTERADRRRGILPARMVVTGAGVLSGTQASAGATTYTTAASYTPTANALQLAEVVFKNGAGITADPTITGCGLTWVLIRRDNNGSNTNTAALYRALGPSPSNGALTIARASTDTWDSATISVTEFTGVDTSGTNGSGAVLQTVKGTTESIVQVYSVNITMSTGAALWAGMACFGNQYTATPRAAWTEVHDINVSGIALETQLLIGTDTAASVTWSGVNAIGWALAVEIKAAASAAPDPLLDLAHDPGWQPLFSRM